MDRDKAQPCEGRATCWSTTSSGTGMWEEVGGVFIHHKDARDTIEQLAMYFPLEANADD